MQRPNFYSLLLIIPCFHFIWILTTVADKYPQGQPLGYYPKVESYYKKDPCPPPDPNVSEDGTVLNRDPNVNDGLPYYPCNYTFGGYEGQFFLANGSYYPCVTPRVISVLRVGGNLSEGVTILKAVHQSIAVKFPAKNNTIPLVAAVVTEGFIWVTNVSTPYQWRKNIRFSEAKKEKVAQRRKDTTPFSKSQVQLAKSLFSSLTDLVDNAERHMVSMKRNNNKMEKESLGPFIVANMQTFSTPSIRALEELGDDDTIEAQRVFGFGGSRFEFEEPVTMAQKIKELVSSSEVPTINLGNLGVDPMQSSRNTLDLFNHIVQMSRDSQNSISDVLAGETERINERSQFNFAIPPVQSGYCKRPIEIDPKNVLPGANGIQSLGMGRVTSRFR